MRPLISAFRGIINTHANKYIANPKFPLHPDVIRAEFRDQAVRAFQTFDPKRKVRLSTHVYGSMRKATRFLMRHQNIGTMPEVRSLRVRDFYEGRAQLAEMLGREPNHFELSRHLNWSPPEVRRMERELRQTGPTTEFEDEPLGMKPSREAEVLNLIQYELGGEEKLVHEYLFGQGGKRRLAPGQIARKLGWTPSKVTRLKNKIMDKIQEYL